ncbi:MAG TPA: VOC family protein [Casimicrobiaceae bacterium]|nr:VOC family protein [Casimicrobiaceae bacterium]
MTEHRAPPDLAPDHLVVAAASLASGVAWVEDRLGVPMQPGGQHVTMGTHNALVGLGPKLYLEVIAIDPSGATPARPRWFDLDDPRMRAQLAEAPSLIHWAARTRDIEADAARSPIGLGTITPMRRGDFEWSLTVPDDGHMRERGLVPTLIQWSGRLHPADALPDRGLRLVALAGEHPEPAGARRALGALGLSETLKVTYGRSPRLAAMLRTPRGMVTL